MNKSEWFFTADWHLGHGNIIKYCKRPFLSKEQLEICDLITKGLVPQNSFSVPPEAIEKMNHAIINNTNDVVRENDNLVILGDFCFTKGSDKLSQVAEFRKQIACKNVFFICGNHDSKEICSKVFTACYDNYLFKIDGQYVFTSHYPARSWDRASHGAWMLYGHVHNQLYKEDNGLLSEYAEKVLSDGFYSVLQRYGIKASSQEIVNDLLSVCSSLNGVNLTLDVGVDNTCRDVAFGTPWSMAEIRDYMKPKTLLWQNRNSNR